MPGWNLPTNRTETNLNNRKLTAFLRFSIPTSRHRCAPKHSLRQMFRSVERREIQTKLKIPKRKPNLVPIYTWAVCVAPRGKRGCILPRGLVNQSRRRLNTEWYSLTPKLKNKACITLSPNRRWPIVQRSPYKEGGERSSPWASLSQVGSSSPIFRSQNSWLKRDIEFATNLKFKVRFIRFARTNRWIHSCTEQGNVDWHLRHVTPCPYAALRLVYAWQVSIDSLQHGGNMYQLLYIENVYSFPVKRVHESHVYRYGMDGPRFESR